MSYNDIAKLNPFQQVSMLKLSDTIEFADEADYQAYLRKK